MPKEIKMAKKDVPVPQVPEPDVFVIKPPVIKAPDLGHYDPNNEPQHEQSDGPRVPNPRVRVPRP